MKRFGFLDILDKGIVHVHNRLDSFLRSLFVTYLNFLTVTVRNGFHNNRLAKIDGIFKKLHRITACSRKVSSFGKVGYIAFIDNKLVDNWCIAYLHVFYTAHFTAKVLIYIFRNPWCTHLVEDVYKRNAFRH